MACSVTGVGEHVMRALLARACADRMLDRDMSVADACSRAIEEGILQVRARLLHRRTHLGGTAYCITRSPAAIVSCKT